MHTGESVLNIRILVIDFVSVFLFRASNFGSVYFSWAIYL